MIRLICVITMLVAIACTFGVVGCMEDAKNTKTKASRNEWIGHGNECYTTVVVIEGHKYIIMDGYSCGNIVHAESCSCKQ